MSEEQVMAKFYMYCQKTGRKLSTISLMSRSETSFTCTGRHNKKTARYNMAEEQAEDKFYKYWQKNR